MYVGYVNNIFLGFTATEANKLKHIWLAKYKRLATVIRVAVFKNVDPYCDWLGSSTSNFCDGAIYGSALKLPKTKSNRKPSHTSTWNMPNQSAKKWSDTQPFSDERSLRMCWIGFLTANVHRVHYLEIIHSEPDSCGETVCEWSRL